MSKILTGNKDVDYIILDYLDDESLLILCQIDRRTIYLCKNDLFWKRRVHKNFKYVRKSEIDTWRNYYLYRLRYEVLHVKKKFGNIEVAIDKKGKEVESILETVKELNNPDHPLREFHGEVELLRDDKILRERIAKSMTFCASEFHLNDMNNEDILNDLFNKFSDRTVYKRVEKKVEKKEIKSCVLTEGFDDLVMPIIKIVKPQKEKSPAGSPKF